MWPIYLHEIVATWYANKQGLEKLALILWSSIKFFFSINDHYSSSTKFCLLEAPFTNIYLAGPNVHERCSIIVCPITRAHMYPLFWVEFFLMSKYSNGLFLIHCIWNKTMKSDSEFVFGWTVQVLLNVFSSFHCRIRCSQHSRFDDRYCGSVPYKVYR